MVVVTPTGLWNVKYRRSGSAGMRTPSTLMSFRLGSTRSPRVASRPSIETRPSRMRSSQARLDPNPARAGGRAAVKLVITEGRKREVRRMLDAVGLPVRRLIRLRVGPVKLGHLHAGDTRELTAEEVRTLYRQTGM